MSLPQRTTDPPHSEDPTEVLAWALDRFPGRVALVSALGPQTLVVLDLLWRMGRSVPVHWIDTGLHFPETLALRARVEARYGLRVEAVTPSRTVAEQAEAEGPRLWERDADRCCGLRKVAPLDALLDRYDAWIAGLRRDQGPSRAAVRTVDLDGRGLVKINPLAAWSREDVRTYVATHDVPTNPLLERGFSSIGCWPCTRPAADPSDERAGRWAEREKTECGLHPATPHPLRRTS